MFNVAFKEVSEDKGRVIEDLRLRVEFLTEETEKLRKASAKAYEAPLAIPVEIRELQVTGLTGEGIHGDGSIL